MSALQFKSNLQSRQVLKDAYPGVKSTFIEDGGREWSPLQTLSRVSIILFCYKAAWDSPLSMSCAVNSACEVLVPESHVKLSLSL